jgi:hypothetical protein
MRIALVIGKHQSIIRIRQILKLANFDLAEGIFGASGIFTRVLAGAYMLRYYSKGEARCRHGMYS